MVTRSLSVLVLCGAFLLAASCSRGEVIKGGVEIKPAQGDSRSSGADKSPNEEETTSEQPETSSKNASAESEDSSRSKPVSVPPQPVIAQPLPPANVPIPNPLKIGMTWHWQLTGSLARPNATLYDVDLFNQNAETIASLKKEGRVVICYFSAGSAEDWRSDYAQFPMTSKGNGLDGWPGETWLDVRDAGVRSVMLSRLDLAKQKGCAGVEPDNVDGFANKSGFDFTANDQIDYLKFLSREAHSRGLLIALKNATDLVGPLVAHMDFAVVEQCFQYEECEAYSPFVQAGKPVLVAEYSKFSEASCAQAEKLKFSLMFFNLDLNGVGNGCKK